MQELSDKRILFVFPGPELGGAERQGLHLARYLKQMGCEVHVWSTLPGEGQVVKECQAEGFPWAAHRFRWPCRKSSLVRDGFRLIRALWKLRPDVILSYTTSPNVGCGLFWRFTPAKACIWGQRNIYELRGDIIERLAYRLVSAVICNAAHEVEYLKNKLGETKRPIHVIRNGLELAPPHKSPHNWRSELNIDQNTVVAVMLANFRPVKDHSTLLQAWSQVLNNINPGMPYLCLVLPGASQNTFQKTKSLAQELRLTNTVLFPGQVQDVSGLLAASDLGILLSSNEGLSNSLLEYMASGLPVIATDHQGSREAIGEDESIQLCLPNNPDDAAARILNLIVNPNLRQRLGKQNQVRAEKHFSINTMCETTLELITELLNSEKR